MNGLALRGRLRRWITRIHRWSGLALVACLLVASVTGVWLVFRVEIDRWINPHLRVVEPAGAARPWAEIVSTVERRFPDGEWQALILPERPGDAAGVYLRPRGKTPLPADQVFVNPYNLTILGGRSTTRVVLSREHLDPLVDRLHYSLLMGQTGLWLMGIVAGAWMVTSLVGLTLAWPRLWHRLNGWLMVLSGRLGRGAYQASYHGHRSVGVWFLPVLLLLAFTSLYQNLPQFVRPVVDAVSPLAVRPNGRPLPPGAAAVTVDKAIASLQRELPDARPTSIGQDRRNGRYSIAFHLPGDLAPHGDNWAFVGLEDGQVLGLKIAANAGAGDKFLTWIFPLHTGTAFGLPGRLLIAAAGIALIVLQLTGLYVWWVKWRMRRRADAPGREPRQRRSGVLRRFLSPRRGLTLRQLLLSSHRWLGLAAGLYFVLVSITGAALVYRIELQRWLHPALFTPTATGPLAHPADVITAVAAAYPNGRPSGVDAPTTARPVYLAYVSEGRRFRTVLLDPVTCALLGELPERSFVRTLQDLHFDLTAGRTGRLANGVGAAALLFMAVSGAIVWWPRQRHWRHWWRGLTIDVRRPAAGLDRNLHRALGMWALLPIAIWGITGLGLAFPAGLRSTVGWLSPLTVSRAPESLSPASATRMRPVRALIDDAARLAPGRHVARIVLPFTDKAAFHVLFAGQQPTLAGEPLTSIYLDQRSGATLTAPASDRSPGDVVISWLVPLHIGSSGEHWGNHLAVHLAGPWGTISRGVWLGFGLAPALLFVTGVVIWWSRRRR